MWRNKFQKLDQMCVKAQAYIAKLIASGEESDLGQALVATAEAWQVVENAASDSYGKKPASKGYGKSEGGKSSWTVGGPYGKAMGAPGKGAKSKNGYNQAGGCRWCRGPHPVSSCELMLAAAAKAKADAPGPKVNW